ncbi:uncharacterized protein LOC111319255 [Stylophora pistillata]|uniref:uncharacterized protein LOC111319255 n=1 Tax=Stylophora pistillata TaxID=50429 RepID=UPI000C04821B|nr:uncharacterized protein LOC111319255 [Stylophora pistillata]
MKTKFGIELLESDFHLYGYMNDDSEQEVYFWRGNADAIGWYYNKWRKKSEYVIVEWKVNRDLLYFWDSRDTYGMFLHQGLLYARLLQVHLNLDYLPSVSIVPIFGDNGKDVHPGLFYDYPDECKKWINDFSWHANAPVPVALPQHIYGRASLFNDDLLKELLINAVPVKKDEPLSSIFKENTKVGELLEALGHDARSLRIHLLKDK